MIRQNFMNKLEKEINKYFKKKITDIVSLDKLNSFIDRNTSFIEYLVEHEDDHCALKEILWAIQHDISDEFIKDVYDYNNDDLMMAVTYELLDKKYLKTQEDLDNFRLVDCPYCQWVILEAIRANIGDEQIQRLKNIYINNSKKEEAWTIKGILMHKMRNVLELMKNNASEEEIQQEIDKEI